MNQFLKICILNFIIVQSSVGYASAENIESIINGNRTEYVCVKNDKLIKLIVQKEETVDRYKMLTSNGSKYMGIEFSKSGECWGTFVENSDETPFEGASNVKNIKATIRNSCKDFNIPYPDND